MIYIFQGIKFWILKQQVFERRMESLESTGFPIELWRVYLKET